jgi:thiol-disulfide isomerase/thioredoxin
MKKLIFTAFLFSFYSALHAQKIIENPRYGMSSTGYITLTKVELTGDATILSFHVTIPQYNWVAIHEKSYIQPVGDTTRLYITKAEGAEIATRIMWEKDKMEEISYRLFFPPLKNDVTRIDFGEPVENSWQFYDIEIREGNFKSPVPAELAGHWFSENTGHWTFSLMDSLAVYAGKTWKYESVLSIDNGIKISLKNNDEQHYLFCRIEDGAVCIMHSDDNPPARFSKDVKHLDKISDTELFNTSSLNSGKVSYSGLIRGFSTRLGSQTGMMRWINRLTNQPESLVLPIRKDGSFHVEFNLDFPKEIIVNLPSGAERVFFEPGKTLFHLVNSGIKDLPTIFGGESAALNYGLYRTQDVGIPMMTFIDPILKMSDEEYIHHVLETREKELKLLEEMKEKYSISPKAIQIRTFDIEYRAANNALRFSGNMNMAKISANRQLKKEDQLLISSVDFDMNLLRKFQDTPLNNELAIISNEYFNLLQSLVYNDMKRQYSAYYYQMAELADEVRRKGNSLTGEENDMLEFIQLNLIKDFDYEKNRLFNQSYHEVLQKFTQKYNAELQKLSRKLQIENMETNIAAMGIDDVRQPLQIFNVQGYLALLKNENQAPDEEPFRKTMESLQNIRLKELVMSAYHQKKARLEAGSATATNTEGDRLFNSIISPYRGKVIYVDFWATWCGPCLSGIERIKPLKEELAQKDIVFLYITNPTSPEAEYRKRIPDIKGEHVKVSKDEWNYLVEKFKIFGIPHYALVSKKGEIVNAHIMHMENDALKERLLEQLEK